MPASSSRPTHRSRRSRYASTIFLSGSRGPSSAACAAIWQTVGRHEEFDSRILVMESEIFSPATT